MSLSRLITLYKKLGETPLQSIVRYRKDHPEDQDINMTYIGRLDPMAEGLLLVLAGNTQNKKQYLDWDKTYEFEVLWGFETDTYDVLGLVDKVGRQPIKLEEKMQSLLKQIANKKTQTYPPYSSRTVGGVPLHAWSRAGLINEVDIPERSIKVFSIDHLNTRYMNKEDMINEIINKINLVEGDFRQEEIKAKWKTILNTNEKVLISSFVADVSSGTYIRSLAHEMGQILGTGALAYSIKRTRVGEYKI